MTRRVLLAVLTATLALCQQANAQATYTLKPTPKTVAWGYYDAKAAPVLRVKPEGEGKAIHSFSGFDFLLAAPKKGKN